MTKRTWLTALVAASGLIVAGCGDGDHDGGHGGGGEASSGKALDRAFAADMIPHHESAIEMAMIAQRRGESPFVKALAEDIITTQTSEIETLQAADKRLSEEGVEKGSLGLADHMKGMDGDVRSLNTAEPFDEAFLKLMIPHHEGAIEMAEIEIAKGADPDLKALAEDIISAQEREIADMREQLG